jgi:hypothetical protein
MYPSYGIKEEEKEAKGPTLHRVSCVSSVVLLGRDTGSLQLLAPLLLTGGKGADLVIRGDVVLNKIDFSLPLILSGWAVSRWEHSLHQRNKPEIDKHSGNRPTRPP